jgi:F-type H+-transporting ATPase subunit b
MLELNKWFFVQLINFLGLIWILNKFLFKPLLRLLKEREERINGSLDSAKAMDKEKEALLHQIDAKLSETRNKAKTIFEELSKEGFTIQKKFVDAAKKDTAEINKKAKKSLEAEVKKIRESLRKEVEIFSKKIVEKMVGV